MLDLFRQIKGSRLRRLGSTCSRRHQSLSRSQVTPNTATDRAPAADSQPPLSRAHLTVQVTLDIPALDILTFVKGLFAAAYAELDLHQTSLKVKAQGDQGQAPFGDLLAQPPGLVAVGQQFSAARRFMVELVAECVGSDMEPDQDQFAPLDRGVGVGKRKLGALERLDLGAAQRDAALQPILDVVEVTARRLVASVLAPSPAAGPLAPRRLTRPPVPGESRAPACTRRPAATRGCAA